MDFTVLMCVYQGDNLEHFKRALTSCATDQTVHATEVLIVQNGPVSVNIETYLTEAQAADSSIKVLQLAENHGLAHALNIGMKEISTEWIARMDADDICLPERFAQQVAYLEQHPQVDALGTALQEFTEPELGRIVWGERRVLPSSHTGLDQYARLQSPLHHPTVMLRKSAVLRAGGYPEDSGRFEDYLLWARMLMHGSTFANLPEVLLGYRVDSGAYNRRGGWEMFRSEFALQRTFLREGFTTHTQFFRNIAVRGVYRLIPTWIKKPLYRLRTAVKNKSVQ